LCLHQEGVKAFDARYARTERKNVDLLGVVVWDLLCDMVHVGSAVASQKSCLPLFFLFSFLPWSIACSAEYKSAQST
jgi:hypothetical protein